MDGLGEHVDQDFVGFEMNAGERDDMTVNEFAMDAFEHPRWFIGSEAESIGRDLSGVRCFHDIYGLEAYQADLRVQPVACEIAGGSARTSRILLGYREEVGHNFDLVCGIDLLNPKERDAFMRYRSRSRVRVVIMSPPCSRFGGWSYLNRAIYPDSWKERRGDDEIIAKFCGDVAIAQYKDDLDWL